MSSIGNAEVIFVGAGPVGLWTAVQTKMRDPSREIVILEKNESYQRSHLLQLSPKSLTVKNISPDAQCYQKFQSIIREFQQMRNIRTTAIEEKLSELAKELGIQILKNEGVTDPRLLKERFPHVKVIVGSDGAHSVVRRQIFGEKIEVKKDLKFVVEVKYEVEGQVKKLDFFKEVYPTLKLMGTIASEHVGKEREGKTPVTLRVFVDEKTFDKMKGASFKKPFTFENELEIHEEVLKNIKTWLHLRGQKQNESRVPHSEKITVTRLGVYASQKIVKKDEEEGITYCLVGDAAFGVPFFRSLNNGLLEGTILAKSISKVFQHRPSLQDRSLEKISSLADGNIEGPFLSYANYVKVISKREIIIARIKSFILDFFLFFVRISAQVPWQVNRWTEAEVQQLQLV